MHSLKAQSVNSSRPYDMIMQYIARHHPYTLHYSFYILNLKHFGITISPYPFAAVTNSIRSRIKHVVRKHNMCACAIRESSFFFRSKSGMRANSILSSVAMTSHTCGPMAMQISMKRVRLRHIWMGIKKKGFSMSTWCVKDPRYYSNCDQLI